MIYGHREIPIRRFVFVLGINSAAPNDPKLSDRGVRRGTCMVSGKAVAEAGAVTHGAVRCSAWLGVSGRIGWCWLLSTALDGWSAGCAMTAAHAKVVNVVGVDDRWKGEA